jgi:hypothetical protein
MNPLNLEGGPCMMMCSGYDSQGTVQADEENLEIG